MKNSQYPRQAQYKQGLGPIVIVIILAVLLGGGYMVWKSGNQPILDDGRDLSKEVEESSTADWKTYRNEKYGFEFKYPADSTTQLVEQYGVSNISVEKGDTVLFQISVDSDVSTGAGFDVNEYPKKVVEGPSEIVVANQKASEYKLRWDFESKTYVYRFVDLRNKNMSYQFSEWPMKIPNESSVGTFDTYLSTFKFTK